MHHSRKVRFLSIGWIVVKKSTYRLGCAVEERFMADYFIGVDGGGTKTLGVLIDASSARLAEVRMESTNLHAVGPALAQQRLLALIDALLAQAGVAPQELAAIGLGMSGVGRPSDRAQVTGWMQARFPAAACFVDNDAVTALAAATGGDLFGIVVISGTGMIVFGVDRQGRRQRAGGWGPLIGEPGGGFSLGAAALNAVAEAADAIGPPTLLTAALLEHLGLAEPSDLVGWAYADVSWARFASLAPLVVQCAQAGDAVSAAILDRAAAALAQRVVAVMKGLGLGETIFPCVLAGGNLAPGLLAARLAEHLRVLAPRAQIMRSQVDAAVGAAWLARTQRARG
jgi:N-acetylglucosamine kinase-like BadF-type ATPase